MSARECQYNSSVIDSYIYIYINIYICIYIYINLHMYLEEQVRTVKCGLWGGIRIGTARGPTIFPNAFGNIEI